MYTYLTTYDTDRHLASLCSRGGFEGRPARRQTHPVRRIRHALSGLARHASIAPVSPVIRLA